MSSFLFSVPAQTEEDKHTSNHLKKVVDRIVDAAECGRVLVKQGELSKQSGDWGLWQKRWYMLSDDAIAYADSKGGSIRGGILLETVVDVRQATPSESRKAHAFIICTKTDRGHYVQQAPSEAQMIDWIKCIRHSVKARASKAAQIQEQSHPWLDKYKALLLAQNATGLAEMFSPHMHYVVNGKLRVGGERLATEVTWKHIFKRVEYTRAETMNVSLGVDGKLRYTEVVTVKSRETDEVLEALFADKSTLTRDGRVAVLERVCSEHVYDTFDRWLSAEATTHCEREVHVYYWPMFGECGAIFRMLEEARIPYRHHSAIEEIQQGAHRTALELPIVVDGERVVGQSIAATVHVGRRCGLSPTVEDETKGLQAMHDMLNLFTDGIVRAAEKGSYELLAFFESSHDGEASRFDQIAASIDRQIQGPFFFGSNPTYVDFFLVQHWDSIHAWGLDRLQAVLGGRNFFAPYQKVLSAIEGIQHLSSYLSYAGPLRTLQDHCVATRTLLEGCAITSNVPELVYFGMPSRAALARLCFHFAGVPFKDTIISPEEWSDVKVEDTIPYTFVPVLRHRGLSLSQSQAIAGYVAVLTLGSDRLPAELRAVDAMLVGTYDDVLIANMDASPASGSDPTLLRQATTAMMERLFAPIERMLPNEGWLHGDDQPSLGDFAIFAMSSVCHTKFGPRFGWVEYVPGWEASYPKIAAYRRRVRALKPLTLYFEKYGAYHL